LQGAALDKVAWHLEHLLDGCSAQPLDQERDESAHGGRLDRRIGVERHAIAHQLDEEVDRRLAFLDPVRSVLEFCKVLGQRGQVLGEIDQ